MVTDMKIVDAATKEVYIQITRQVILRGLGGYGHKGTYKSSMPNKPARAADHTKLEPTLPNQAILYRLCGDLNPLHIYPEFAAMGKFPRPILPGLCTSGIVAKAVYQQYVESGDASEIVKVGSRFTSHIFPGETLIVEMWKIENGIIYYEAKTKERGFRVIQGYMQVRNQAKL